MSDDTLGTLALDPLRNRSECDVWLIERRHVPWAAKRGFLAAIFCMCASAYAATLSVEERAQHNSFVAQAASNKPSVGSTTNATTLDGVLASQFAKKYSVTKQRGWPVGKDGNFNNVLSVVGIDDSVVEVTTRGARVVHAGVTFIGISKVDGANMTFVLAFLKALNLDATPGTGTKVALERGLRVNVEQISLAPTQSYGRLRVRSAKVGNDAVISIDLP